MQRDGQEFRNDAARAAGLLCHQQRRAWFGLLALATLYAVASGCATTGKARPVEALTLPPGAPSLDEIVADLRANDEALTDFRAAASFTLTSPRLESVQSFRSGTVAYRKPADLYIVGKKNMGVVVFELISRGPEFLIDFKSVQDVDDRYYCSFEADDLANVPFPVAPADIAHEMFSPIDWTKTKDKDIRLTAFDEAAGQATLDVALDGGLVRQIVVQGEPWRIVHNTLTDATGTTLSDTTMDNYQDVDGVRIPTALEARFPVEETHVTFELRNVRANTGLPGINFTWDWPPGQ
ncbi:MAG: hypothetical protein HUU46_05265 [Candidatus Hydrogenedentes bacterium]|nr:hypothetical protein [Candidatus Hydrogenedentota bacterium]